MQKINESFVNYQLMKDIQKAHDNGIIQLNMSLNSEYEENHLSELERIFTAFDEAEDFIAISALIKNKRDLFIKILNYMNTEGE